MEFDKIHKEHYVNTRINVFSKIENTPKAYNIHSGKIKEIDENIAQITTNNTAECCMIIIDELLILYGDKYPEKYSKIFMDIYKKLNQKDFQSMLNSELIYGKIVFVPFDAF